jgi:hypothetical protein
MVLSPGVSDTLVYLFSPEGANVRRDQSLEKASWRVCVTVLSCCAHILQKRYHGTAVMGVLSLLNKVVGSTRSWYPKITR